MHSACTFAIWWDAQIVLIIFWSNCNLAKSTLIVRLMGI